MAGGARAGARWCGVRLVLLAIAALALSGMLCGCGSGAVDANEPNDEPGAATALSPGVPIDGVIAADDVDIFRCDAPDNAGTHSFVVTVRTEASEDVDVKVGASIPGAWEGITWPAWRAVVGNGAVTVEGRLKRGTVLVVLGGEQGTAYSLEIEWR